MTLFALQRWSLLPVYAVPEIDDSEQPDLVVGMSSTKCLIQTVGFYVQQW